jgi:uncharacterized protein
MQHSYSRSLVLNCVVWGEALLLLFATIWIHLAHIDLVPSLTLKDPGPLFLGAILGALMSLSSMFLAKQAVKYKDRFKFLASFDEMVSSMLQPLFKDVTPIDIGLIALSSGFCEEIFFRGVLQTQFGLVIAAIIFGLVHFAGPKYMFYMFWAMGAGLFLGALFQFSQILWIPIVAHIVNNLVSITMIRYEIGYKNENES